MKMVLGLSTCQMETGLVVTNAKTRQGKQLDIQQPSSSLMDTVASISVVGRAWKSHPNPESELPRIIRQEISTN
jgi:hypothetical protein